jgi:MGT family glycosyltransferase
VAHLGVLCYQGAGHLNPLVTLSRELLSRGHRVTFFLPREFESRIRDQGLDFFPIDVSEVEPARRNDGSTTQPTSAWIEDTRARLDRLDKEIGVYMREYLAAISAVRIDALLMGEITLAGPTVAEILRIPYFVVSTSIPHNFGWSAPPALLPHRTWQKELQARIFQVSIFCMRGPVRRVLDRRRRQAGLGSVADIGRTFPELAHITQWPRCLDTPREELPDRFFYTGPFVDARARSSIEFPWHRLNGQPLVYASLGTTRKADPEIYHRIASACAGLDVQLVVTLGGRRNLESFTNLPGDPLVVESAPQLDLLERSDLVITHAGPNTALETLLFGKPMLALPVALDQPAVATHLERLGVAEVLAPQQRSADEIRQVLLKLGTESRYREAAKAIQTQLQSLRGTAQAASIIEEALANQMAFDGAKHEAVTR